MKKKVKKQQQALEEYKHRLLILLLDHSQKYCYMRDTEQLGSLKGELIVGKMLILQQIDETKTISLN